MARNAPAAEVEVDCGQTIGRIRALHGGNGGPLGAGGLIDLSPLHRELRIPYTRLHDCHWPNPDVVDIHTVFPDPGADPVRPESYDFARTDAYIQAVIDVGSRPVYRLGESIEHTRRKYHVHPPSDVEKWAAVCLGIIRHYNEGWAGGFRHDIRYWEIWNEPENRPAMWTGSDEDYLRLYEAAARMIKSRFPGLRVGGPSLGDTGRIADGRLEPSGFLLTFLDRCRERRLPLDFFSWHLYTDDPSECLLRARSIRELLNRSGFEHTELHLNEWNYLPDRDWSPMMLEGQGPPRDRFYARIGGAEGAAFSAAVLMNLQDSPVDVANYYSMDTQAFGMFGIHGTPTRVFHAFRAFRELQAMPARVRVSCNGSQGLTACAGANGRTSEVRVLVSSARSSQTSIRVTVKNHGWSGSILSEVLAVDGSHEWAPVSRERLEPGDLRITLESAGPTVFLVRLSPTGSSGGS